MFSVKKAVMATLLIVSAVFTTAPAMADSYSVDITISNLGDFNLASFDLDVTYDSSLLTFSDYTLTEELGSFTGPDPISPDAEDWSWGDYALGTVNLAVVSYLDDLSSQPDTFTLATLSFSGDESALDAISISYLDLSDDFGDPIPVSVNGTHINVVPIPGAIWMALPGLLGIIGVRRRTNQ
ncbi:uncharacterized protein Dvar_11940 [Desulfosarcina variabilis str. Montpellier]|uniref:hypothetical protein n=1 Tax=Desulfosarcina variabilis TaxID=2300 RepID=UPI003AFB5119